MNLEQKLSEMAEKHSQKSIHIGFRNTAYFSYREGLKDVLELPEVKVLVEALEYYGKRNHFEWCGKDDFAPENPSGEPLNFESGGAEGSEFNLENGGIARQALSTWKKFKG